MFLYQINRLAAYSYLMIITGGILLDVGQLN